MQSLGFPVKSQWLEAVSGKWSGGKTLPRERAQKGQTGPSLFPSPQLRGPRGHQISQLFPCPTLAVELLSAQLGPCGKDSSQNSFNSSLFLRDMKDTEILVPQLRARYIVGVFSPLHYPITGNISTPSKEQLAQAGLHQNVPFPGAQLC